MFDVNGVNVGFDRLLFRFASKQQPHRKRVFAEEANTHEYQERRGEQELMYIDKLISS